MADELWDRVKARLEEIAQQACRDIAEAWAAEIQVTAPRDTGLLADTAHAEGDELALQPYWKYVAFGHRIYSPKTKGLIVIGVDAMGNTVHKSTKPNPFMEDAWEGAKVQAVLRRYAGRYVRIPYPLKRVGR